MNIHQNHFHRYFCSKFNRFGLVFSLLVYDYNLHLNLIIRFSLLRIDPLFSPVFGTYFFVLKFMHCLKSLEHYLEGIFHLFPDRLFKFIFIRKEFYRFYDWLLYKEILSPIIYFDRDKLDHRYLLSQSHSPIF